MSEPNDPKTPEWVNETPILTYHLAAIDFDRHGEAHQEIDLDLREYELLKQRLAEMRGHMPERTQRKYRLIVETTCGPMAGKWERDVELTADEHNRLKQHLDKMRVHSRAGEEAHA
jgi:hypothetical protein